MKNNIIHSIENKSTTPFVSILMPVYNAEKFLAEAVESILKQSYSNFELLLLNDGSTDKSSELMEIYQIDSRVKIIHNNSNKGLIYTLNKGLNLAVGQYITRMDADDICSRERLQVQVDYMEKNKDIMLCGTWVKRFRNKLYKRKVKGYLLYEDILATLVFECAIVHATIMIRREIVDNGDFKYNSDYAHVEDHELFIRLASKYKLTNIPYYGLLYRIYSTSVSGRFSAIQKKNAHRCSLLAIENLSRDNPELLKSYVQLINFQGTDSTEYVSYSNAFFNHFRVKNSSVANYFQWRESCRHASLGLPLFIQLLRLGSFWNNTGLKKSLILFILCILKKDR